MTMQRKRIINKKTPNKVATSTPVKPMSESGASYGKKARRDSTAINARDGKKPAAAVDDFGGEVIIEGELSAKQKAEILAIVRNTGKTGPRDGNERVTHINDKGGKIRIMTSGHELAVSIGKRIHHSHKGGKLTIVWGTDEAPVRVHWIKK